MLLVCVVLIFFVLILSFIIRQKPVRNQHKLIVVCTTSIITDIVQRIGGNNIVVHGLMGPGIDPHLYRARESDMHKLAAADLIFYNGLHLEGKMSEVFASMGRYTKTVAVTDAIPKEQLRSSEFVDLYDPHVWHDVRMWMLVVQFIITSMSEADPNNAQTYQGNGEKLLKKLDKLDKYVITKVQQVPASQRILVTAHDAFGYFGKRYGFEVVGLQGLSTDSQIGIKDIQQLTSFIVNNRVHALFVESSIPQRNIQAVQHAVEARDWYVTIGQELFSDALGDPQTLAGSYVGMIKHNIDTIIAEITRHTTC